VLQIIHSPIPGEDLADMESDLFSRALGVKLVDPGVVAVTALTDKAGK
jgi:hypothetical protein